LLVVGVILFASGIFEDSFGAEQDGFDSAEDFLDSFDSDSLDTDSDFDTGSDGDFIGRWTVEGVEFDRDANEVTLRNLRRIPNCEGIIEEEFRTEDDAPFREQVTLKTRVLAEDENQMFQDLIAELNEEFGDELGEIDPNIQFHVMIRDAEALKYRLPGMAFRPRDGVKHAFLRDDILHPERHLTGDALAAFNAFSPQEKRGFIKEALHHEILEHTVPWQSNNIAKNAYSK